MIRAIPAVLFLCLAPATPRDLLSQSEYAAPILAGLSNQGQNLGEPYVTAGDRTYLIGTQDGNFPDMGDHVPGEMGGLWLHPVKLIDGFWAQVTDEATGQRVALSKSPEFINYPYGNRFKYGTVLDRLIREEIMRDSMQTYVDVFTPMLRSDGQSGPELFLSDSLHMTRAGYEI